MGGGRWQAMKERIAALDGLRGMAALLVLFAHFSLFGVRNGTLGVDVFFVLSGFLITGLLANDIEATGTIRFRHFYIRRFLRLMPALVMAVLLFTAIDLVFGIHNPVTVLWSSAASLLYVSNFVRTYDAWNMIEFGHTWSLAIEEQFYLIWPALFLGLAWLAPRFRGALLGALLAFVALTAWRYGMMANDYPKGRIWSSFESRSPAIFLGAAFALLPRSGLISDNWLRPILRAVAPVGLAAVMFVLVVNRDYMLWQQPLVLLGTAALVLHLSMDGEGWLASMFSVGWLAWTGRISYGIYLYHYPLWYLTIARWSLPNDIEQAICLFVLTPLTYVLAWASFKYVEQPIMSFKPREALQPSAVTA